MAKKNNNPKDTTSTSKVNETAIRGISGTIKNMATQGRSKDMMNYIQQLKDRESGVGGKRSGSLIFKKAGGSTKVNEDVRNNMIMAKMRESKNKKK